MAVVKFDCHRGETTRDKEENQRKYENMIECHARSEVEWECLVTSWCDWRTKLWNCVAIFFFFVRRIFVHIFLQRLMLGWCRSANWWENKRIWRWVVMVGYMRGVGKYIKSLAIIPIQTYLFSSDHRSQADSGLVSTVMGDRTGTLGVASLHFLMFCALSPPFFFVFVPYHLTTLSYTHPIHPHPPIDSRSTFYQRHSSWIITTKALLSCFGFDASIFSMKIIISLQTTSYQRVTRPPINTHDHDASIILHSFGIWTWLRTQIQNNITTNQSKQQWKHSDYTELTGLPPRNLRTKCNVLSFWTL